MESAQFDDKKVYKGKCTLGYLVALYSGCFYFAKQYAVHLRIFWNHL